MKLLGLSRIAIGTVCGLIMLSPARYVLADDDAASMKVSKPVVDFGEDQYTLSAWIKTTATGPIFTVAPLDGNHVIGSRCIYIGESGRLNYRIEGAGHTVGGPKINDGRWHQITLTRMIYVDGKRASHGIDNPPDLGSALSPVFDSPGGVLKIGQGAEDYPNDTVRQFTGQVDDVRIYDRRMSDQEIVKHFDGETEFRDTNLLAHWPFDGHTKDTTGAAHDLRPVGEFHYVEGRDGGKSVAFDGAGAVWLPLTDHAEGKTAHIITSKLPEITEPTYTDTQYGPALVKEMGFQHLLFVKRDTYTSSHFYSDFIDGCGRFGSNICVLDMLTGEVKDLFEGKMTEGIFGRVDLSFDAKRIVFGWKASEWEGFRIYESNVDGTGLRQITFPPQDEALRIKKYDRSSELKFAKIYHHQTDDLHPCYLPDDGIMFVSSRCEYGTLCNSDDQLATTVLYRVERDGSKLTKLTNSAVSEFTPSVAEDGRVIYTRWEYIDKGQLGVKCLWSMNPDGTASREVYGNNIRFPPTLIQGRQIPGYSNLFVAIGSPHYPQSGTGTVVLIDTTKPIRTLEPMSYITPYVKVMQEGGYNQYDFETNYWTRSPRGPLYRDPYPLSERSFIVSHNEDRTRDVRDPSAYGLYTLDRNSHHKRIYRDPDTSTWCAQPLRPRVRPPIVEMPRDEELAGKGLAVCSVMDIYHGMENVERGEVKWIRIMEQIPRPWASRRRWEPACGHTQIAGGGGPLSVKLLRGIVPVEEDGSANFYVPADRNIYFEALNEDYLELQRERTYVNYRPGETRSCIGCHETPDDAPPMMRMPLALGKPPVMPQPQPGDKDAARPLHYAVDIQPILDEKCVSCHGETDPAADLRLTGEHAWLANTSASQLRSKGYVPGFLEGSDFGGTEYIPAKTIGSYVSPLMKQIKKGCPGNENKLTLAEWVRIATWIDANGVYHGSYWGRIVPPHSDHPNYRPTPTLEQAIGTVNPYEEWTPQWRPPTKEN
ncbi:hypothetical protein CA13_60990 [Planctomycetes bacterium CA13]|uniref:Hydrazine synthase alpha subunit middle domain-containing protein n=1 Tax=Novipirellula herctigrandis TaxID=2527986 RepID=A0A5C5ZB62_9BACT|nr:hypothetical protein CA13_60990 [Planctomycetes bacterium CA13]